MKKISSSYISSNLKYKYNYETKKYTLRFIINKSNPIIDQLFKNYYNNNYEVNFDDYNKLIFSVNNFKASYLKYNIDNNFKHANTIWELNNKYRLRKNYMNKKNIHWIATYSQSYLKNLRTNKKVKLLNNDNIIYSLSFNFIIEKNGQKDLNGKDKTRLKAIKNLNLKSKQLNLDL